MDLAEQRVTTDLAEQRVTTDLAEQRVTAKLVVAYFVMNFRMFKHHFPKIIFDDVPNNMKRYYLSAARDCISAQYRGDYEKQYFAYKILYNIMTHKEVPPVFKTSHQFIVCKTREDISKDDWVMYVLNPTGEYQGFDKLTKFGSDNKFRIEIPVDKDHPIREFQGVIRAYKGKTSEDALRLFFDIEAKYLEIDTGASEERKAIQSMEAKRKIEASKEANEKFSASLLEGPSSAHSSLAPLFLAHDNKKTKGDKRKGTKRGKKAGRKNTKRKR